MASVSVRSIFTPSKPIPKGVGFALAPLMFRNTFVASSASKVDVAKAPPPSGKGDTTRLCSRGVSALSGETFLSLSPLSSGVQAPSSPPPFPHPSSPSPSLATMEKAEKRRWVPPCEHDVRRDAELLRADAARVRHLRAAQEHADAADALLQAGRARDGSEVATELAGVARSFADMEAVAVPPEGNDAAAAAALRPPAAGRYTSKRAAQKREELRRALAAAAWRLNSLCLKTRSVALLEMALRAVSLKGWVGDLLVPGRVNLRCTTLRNMACLKRREGDLRGALWYLEKARQTEVRLCQGCVSADTLVAVGSILTQIGQPQEGADCSRQAVRFLRKQRGRSVMEGGAAAADGAGGGADGGGGDTWNTFLLATAWYNLGVAQATMTGGGKGGGGGCDPVATAAASPSASGQPAVLGSSSAAAASGGGGRGRAGASQSFSNAQKHVEGLPHGAQFDHLRAALHQVRTLPPLRNALPPPPQPADAGAGTASGPAAAVVIAGGGGGGAASSKLRSSSKRRRRQQAKGAAAAAGKKRSPLEARLPRIAGGGGGAKPTKAASHLMIQQKPQEAVAAES